MTGKFTSAELTLALAHQMSVSHAFEIAIKRGSMNKFTVAEAISHHLSANTDYTQLFERGSFDIGFYRPIKFDKQTPHTRDELYIVASGSGEFFCGNETQSFSTGDIFFVPAGVEHGFVKFTYDFATWVVFFRT